MKMKIINFVLVFLVSVMLAACSGGGKPQPTFFKMPEYKDEIQNKAFKEGCESGFSVYGNTYWRTFYHYKSDLKLMNSNKIYSRIWWDSFNYCRHYVNRYLMDGYFSAEGPGSGKDENFNGNLRNTKFIESKGFTFPLWDGLNTPGWGEHTWGGSVGGADWLGRSGKDKVDWLGRTSAFQ